MQAIEQCRTEALGGQVYHCDTCDEFRYSYHSCKNRHCPKCQNQAGQQWLEKQQALLLPVPYFMVTLTLPEGMRALARSNQRPIYDLLFQTSAAALQQLAHAPRFVGGQIGLLGVLQTWTCDLRYHPHIHYLVPAGALSADGQAWCRARNAFFVRVEPLSRLFRGKFRAALAQTDLIDQIPASVWWQEWVVHCQPVGTGQAALKYLAAYIFRVALSNNRILKLEAGQVTFRYRDRVTRRWKTRTLPAEEFIRRSLACSTFCPKAFRKSAITASLAPVNVTASSRCGNYSAQLARHSQPTWLKTSLSLPHPPTHPSSLVPPVAGPCAAPRPCRRNIAAPPNRSDEAQPNRPSLQPVSLRSQSADPLGLSPDQAASLTATFPFCLG